MKQKVIVPAIKPCAICGTQGRLVDWDFNEMYQVMCDLNHSTKSKYQTVNRAVCKWNNLQSAILENNEKGGT